jgi:hypothetical protein
MDNNHIPSTKSVVVGAETATPCRFYDIDDVILSQDDTKETHAARARREHEEDQHIAAALSLMTKSQRACWEAYLETDVTSLNDLAARMGLRRQTVTPNIERGLKRARRKSQVRKLSASPDIE